MFSPDGTAARTDQPARTNRPLRLGTRAKLLQRLLRDFVRAMGLERRMLPAIAEREFEPAARNAGACVHCRAVPRKTGLPLARWTARRPLPNHPSRVITCAGSRALR